ncbi:unnamed protein product [Schistocephalus solidus]|uniref:Uncharacterized protein n=1 Tax=Schistocephalus solidus TaxID=70667 RepID=A0A3P7E957_SCHSO|nr:unnamed protein product [Schistocephalus solidus]
MRNLPISEREASCVARLTDLRDAEDSVMSRATDRLMKAVHKKDESFLRSMELYPAKPKNPEQPDSVLQLGDLLDDHKRRLQELGTAPRPPHLYTKDVRLAAIINAVEAEQKQSDKRRKKEPTTAATGGVGTDTDRLQNLLFQRKPTRKRQHQQAAVSQRGKHASSRYIRGFFNLIRLLLLEMASPEEEGLNTEQICELVNAWQSTPRAQRTNSPWINRCPDWSLVAAHALRLLSTSGRGSPLARLVSSTHTDQQIRLPPRGFVAYNEKYDTWYWLGGGSGNGGISQPADVDLETTLLARLFAIWAKADNGVGGLKDVWMETGHSFEEYSLPPSPQPSAKRSRAPTRALPNGGDRRHHAVVGIGEDSENEFSYGEDEQEEEEVDDLRIISSSLARARLNGNVDCRRRSNVAPSKTRQEIQRFSQPWSPFVYNQHGYASVVGPVRTASVNFAGRGSGRAREHPLLRSDRPAWVSISEIVRDAVARLPNGEGTRPEIAMLVQDSAFLAPNFNPRQDCCLASGDFFELATTTTLRGHPIKLRVTGARLDTRRFFFSSRVIKAWNALPADIIMSPSVDTFKRKFDQYSHKQHQMSPILFNYAIEWILGKVLLEDDGIEFAPGCRLTDLDYTDDIVLPSSSFGDLHSVVSHVNMVAKSVDLSPNAGKTSVVKPHS